MNPIFRMFVIISTLGLLFALISACGEKHLHVSTTSEELSQEGEPEAPMAATEPDQEIQAPPSPQPATEVPAKRPDAPIKTPDSSPAAAIAPSAGKKPRSDDSMPVERIPGNTAVAKAVQSDAAKDELNRIREEEMATRAAGIRDVFFAFDSWAINQEGKQALEISADWLGNKPAATLLIEGHCDERGTQAYNIVLGKKRAGAIRDYLIQLGVASTRLSFISYGHDKPFCSDQTETCYQLNRRGHLLVQKP